MAELMEQEAVTLAAVEYVRQTGYRAIRAWWRDIFTAGLAEEVYPC